MAVQLRKLAVSPSLTEKLRCELELRLPPISKLSQTRVYTKQRKNKSRFNEEYATLREAEGLLTYPEAARFLGISYLSFQKARKSRLVPEPIQGVRGKVFKKNQLDQLRQRLDDRIPEPQARRMFGLSTLACQQLIAAGRLDGLRDTLAILMASGPYVRRGDIYDLIVKLHERSGNATPTGGLVSLHEVLRSIGARDKPWVPLFDAILSGTIPIHPGIDATLHLEALRVPRSAVHTIQCFRFDFDNFPEFERSRTLSGPEWAEYLNIGKPAKELIIQKRLLPVNTISLSYLCPLPAVVAFAEKYISLWEMRAVLGISQVPLPKLRQVLADRDFTPTFDQWFWDRGQFNRSVLSNFLPTQ